MNEELKDYTVLADAGITISDVEYAKDTVVSLSDTDAASFLEAGTIALQNSSAPETLTQPQSDEPVPVAPVSEQESDSSIDPLTGSPVGAVDTSSLTPEILDVEQASA